MDVLKVLRDLGAGLDAVSPWEVLLGVKLGFPRERILLTGNNVSDEEMRFVRELGVLINVDSLSQLRRYGGMFPGAEISIRVNPSIGAGHHGYAVTGGLTKFGIYLNQLGRVLDIAREFNLRVVGLHAHTGSGILSPEPYLRTLEVLLGIARRLSSLEFVDVGGGFSIPYRPGERPLDLAYLGSKISKLLERFEREYYHVKLRVEPGRYLVANAGILLVRVVDVKEVEVGSTRKVFVGVDPV